MSYVIPELCHSLATSSKMQQVTCENFLETQHIPYMEFTTIFTLIRELQEESEKAEEEYKRNVQWQTKKNL